MLFGGPPSPGGDDDDEMPVDVEQLLASILPRSFGGIEAFAQAQGMRRARPADRKRLDHLLDEHAYSEPQPDEVVEEAVVTTTRAGRSRLAKRKFDLEDVKDKINCPICIETREPGCDCLRMPCCGQRFHRACAIKWLTKESDKCPTCRAPLEDAPKKKKRDYGNGVPGWSPYHRADELKPGEKPGEKTGLPADAFWFQQWGFRTGAVSEEKRRDYGYGVPMWSPYYRSNKPPRSAPSAPK